MIDYRQAQINDIPILKRLANEIWHKHYPGIISIEQIDFMLEKLYSEEVIKREIEHGVYWIILLFDEQPAGFISCEMEDQHTCKLNKIYIYPHLHGKGIGRKGIELAKMFARLNSANKLKLFVNRGNTDSIKAYNAFGFQIEQEIDQYIGEYLLDDYIMTMKL